jgi:hypothetical protein
MICKFDYNKIDDMPTTIVKIGKKAAKEEKVANVSYEIDYAASNIVRKTLEMAETLKKYPRPTRK